MEHTEAGRVSRGGGGGKYFFGGRNVHQVVLSKGKATKFVRTRGLVNSLVSGTPKS